MLISRQCSILQKFPSPRSKIPSSRRPASLRQQKMRPHPAFEDSVKVTFVQSYPLGSIQASASVVQPSLNADLYPRSGCAPVKSTFSPRLPPLFESQPSTSKQAFSSSVMQESSNHNPGMSYSSVEPYKEISPHWETGDNCVIVGLSSCRGGSSFARPHGTR